MSRVTAHQLVELNCFSLQTKTKPNRKRIFYQPDLLGYGAITKCLRKYLRSLIGDSRVHIWVWIHLKVQWSIGRSRTGVNESTYFILSNFLVSSRSYSTSFWNSYSHRKVKSVEIGGESEKAMRWNFIEKQAIFRASLVRHTSDSSSQWIGCLRRPVILETIRYITQYSDIEIFRIEQMLRKWNDNICVFYLNGKFLFHVKVIIVHTHGIHFQRPFEYCSFTLFHFVGHRMTWSAYHRAADIFSYLDYLASTYPDLCKLQTIGYSAEKRPLKVLR